MQPNKKTFVYTQIGIKGIFFCESYLFMLCRHVSGSFSEEQKKQQRNNESIDNNNQLQ